MIYNIAIIEEKRKNNYNVFLKYNLNIHIFNSPFSFIRYNNILDFNLIITDIIMPEMTGIEFLKRIIERNEIYKKIPILFFSELSKDKIIQKRLNKILSSFNINFLPKPTEEKILIVKTMNIINNSKNNKYNQQTYIFSKIYAEEKI
ncbi:MAG TPA: response regulator [Spirochaetota bacterium]|nr:response regulator [Spirochaetota bacterium]HOL56363.1 response regulator [Spirochaetota bacterium]HPP03662.1 response regulator [Spirochaetota bacterium]